MKRTGKKILFSFLFLSLIYQCSFFASGMAGLDNLEKYTPVFGNNEVFESNNFAINDLLISLEEMLGNSYIDMAIQNKSTVSRNQDMFSKETFENDSTIRSSSEQDKSDGSVGDKSIFRTSAGESIPKAAKELPSTNGKLQSVGEEIKNKLKKIPTKINNLLESGKQKPNPLASADLPATLSLYNYIKANEGKKIISGQQEGRADNKEEEFELIRNWTGKTPAIRGFDLLTYFQNGGNWQDGTIERAIDWAKNKNGIVAITWHWPSPESWDQESFYAQKTGFSLKNAMQDSNSWEARGIDKDIDKAAEMLLRLKNEGIPVLWRPLHEAEMGWFWWGREKDPNLTKALYLKIFNRFKEKGLNNLIWVWANSDSSYYPGDNYVDIIGADAYWIWGGGTAEQTIKGVRSYATGRKMQAITENDKFPSANSFKDWSWFMNWYNVNGKMNSYDEVKSVYDNPDVITLEQLPKDLYTSNTK